MKKLLTLLFILLIGSDIANAKWEIAGDRIKTQWAEQVSPENVWAEYPRPQLVRQQWQNLNGLWEYAITDINASQPTSFDGEILVPFAIESALSGVQKRVSEKQVLWYHRRFSIPTKWKGSRIMLNFGAVDWSADVYVNNTLAASHTGGYAPFSVDITPLLVKGEQDIVVKVWDPTTKGSQPVGKQNLKPNGIWYTPVTGIWQTVWLEPVAECNHIEAIEPIYNIKRHELTLRVDCLHNDGCVDVALMEGDKVVASSSAICGTNAKLTVNNPKLWSCETPTLYDLKVTLRNGSKVVDSITSYVALREVGKVRDEYGHLRMTLNGKPIFMYGPLDQGWWPDGLYTAPNDEALRWDITFTKSLGFNTIRKHVKVEPARWYYHCDREGMLVWQDMPSSVRQKPHVWGRNEIGGGTDKPETATAKRNYYKEWGEVIDALRFFQSIVVWVPFNEAWGQFDTEAVAAWTAEKDGTRLINAASGGNLRLCGDILDIHNYPRPDMPFHNADYVVVLGEYGGIGFPIKENLWGSNRNWGYIEFKNSQEVTERYVKYALDIIPFIKQGMAAAIYTQTTDVEGEVNGFVTYDRKVVKMDIKQLEEVNKKVINTLK